jgi:hypothetical protein
MNTACPSSGCSNARIGDLNDTTKYTSPISFSGCCWSNISNSDHGGAIYYSGSSTTGSISIFECTFQDIDRSVYYGGALYITQIGSVNISSSIFQTLRKSDYGAGYIDSIGKCVLIHNCFINDCNASGGAVGSIRLNTYSIPTPDDCVNHSTHGTVFGCFFK